MAQAPNPTFVICIPVVPNDLVRSDVVEDMLCSSVPGLVNSCSVPVMPRASGPDSSGKTSRAAGARHRVAVAPGIIRRHQRASSSTSITTAKVSSSTVVTTPNSSTREALSR